jgi:hypothetical protein
LSGTKAGQAPKEQTGQDEICAEYEDGQHSGLAKRPQNDCCEKDRGFAYSAERHKKRVYNGLTCEVCISTAEKENDQSREDSINSRNITRE